MGIKLIEDVGAPLAVTAIDLIVETTRPDWNEWASYIVAGLGYGSQAFRIPAMGGEFSKNMGIAALPWAAKNIYNRVRGISGVRSKRLRTVARWPAPLVEQPFGGARLV